MNEQSKQIAERIGAMTEQMTDAQKEKLLAFADGMATASKLMQPEQKQSA